MRKDSNLKIGTLGETIACKYLISLGYKIVERNFRTHNGEIDIVAYDHNTVVFVEVKTRCTNTYGFGQEAITPWKLRSLIKSVHYYQLTHPRVSSSMRIDVVSINLNSDKTIKEIEVFKNITL